MFSVCYNYCIKSSKYWKSTRKISNIKPFIDQYNWEGIKFPAHQNGQEENEKSIDWKKFEQNNKTIALNILYVPHNKKEIGVAYRSKYNRKRENQVVLLMITNG